MIFSKKVTKVMPEIKKLLVDNEFSIGEFGELISHLLLLKAELDGLTQKFEKDKSYEEKYNVKKSINTTHHIATIMKNELSDNIQALYVLSLLVKLFTTQKEGSESEKKS